MNTVWANIFEIFAKFLAKFAQAFVYNEYNYGQRSIKTLGPGLWIYTHRYNKSRPAQAHKRIYSKESKIIKREYFIELCCCGNTVCVSWKRLSKDDGLHSNTPNTCAFIFIHVYLRVCVYSDWLIPFWTIVFDFFLRVFQSSFLLLHEFRRNCHIRVNRFDD